MKNCEAWFDFARRELDRQPLTVEVTDTSPLLKTLSFPDLAEGDFSFAAIPVNEEEIGASMESGVPTQLIDDLDRSLKSYRETDRQRPMAAFIKPEGYWTRSPAWVLGEYLAERDLLLWVDLLHLHPERAVAWTRFLTESGLACPRCFVLVSEGIPVEDLPSLSATGIWLLRMSQSGGEGTLQQV